MVAIKGHQAYQCCETIDGKCDDAGTERACVWLIHNEDGAVGLPNMCPFANFSIPMKIKSKVVTIEGA
jgi:hypothetical protein